MKEGWIVAPMPENESARLAALYNYDVLDTLSEDAFDRITRLASLILKTPIAVVSLVDKNRQWFKSHHGIDATETPREVAFCAHAILKNEVLLVPDATKDQRFFANPLVTGAPEIRFYAGAPLRTPDGLNIGTLCAIDMEANNEFGDEQRAILSDLAAMVIDELELRLAIRNEKIASLAKSSFLANMSHEIRTPMNGIIGMAELLLDSKLSKSQHLYASTITQSADALLEIINDILDFSKIESGKMELDNATFDMRIVCSDAIKLLTNKCKEKGIKIQMNYKAEEEGFVLGDSGRVRQVIINLLSNAIKFTDEGEVTLDVEQLKINAPEKIKFKRAVTDTGIGIPIEHQSKMFGKFSQIDPSSTRKFGGTGLGLAICKELTQMMGGDITLQSENGVGSTFTATIILQKTGKNNSNIDEMRPQDIISNVAFKKGAKILLVEDNRVNILFAKETLESLGCKISIANDGIEAVDCFKKGEFDLILMDVQMPKMDGYDATREIRKFEKQHNKKATPIIALTANAIIGDDKKCIASGMDDYISKPFKKADLQAIFCKWLKDRRK